MGHVAVKGDGLFIEGHGPRGHTPRSMNGQPDKPEVIGPRLRAIRLAAGYERQEAFAAICDISPQAWNNYERGRQTPRIDQLSKIRQATGVTADFILYGDPRGLTVEMADRIRRAEAAA